MSLGQASCPLLSPPYVLLLMHPPCLRDNTQRPLPHSCRMTEVPPIPPGNQAFAQAMSRSSTPHLSEPASPSSVQRLPPPLAFLAEVFADTRDSLHLDPTLVPNLTPHALHTISTGEGSTLSILYATVSGIVAITNQLDTVTTQLSALAKENGNSALNYTTSPRSLPMRWPLLRTSRRYPPPYATSPTGFQARDPPPTLPLLRLPPLPKKPTN